MGSPGIRRGAGGHADFELMTAYQLLHRVAGLQRRQRVLVQEAGTVSQALLTLGKMAELEVWGTVWGEHTGLVRDLGATPIDYQRGDFARVLPGRFDIVFDGIGEDGFVARCNWKDGCEKGGSDCARSRGRRDTLFDPAPPRPMTGGAANQRKVLTIETSRRSGSRLAKLRGIAGVTDRHRTQVQRRRGLGREPPGKLRFAKDCERRT